MDRGGLKHNPRDNSFVFSEQAGEVGFVNDIGKSARVQVPPTDDSSNGLNSSNLQRDRAAIGLGPRGRRAVEGTHVKEIGKLLRIQSMQSHQDALGPMNIGDSFSLLDETLADLNSSSTSGTSNTRELDPFHIKTEDLSPAIDKDRQEGLVEKDSDLGEATLDILRHLDLPGSLTELSELYVADEAAFLSSLAVDDAMLGDSLVKEKKSGDGGVGGGCVGNGSGGVGCNGGGCAGVNGADTRPQHRPPGQQPQPLMQSPSMNMPVIKTEKDAGYIQLCTPGVIKMENENRSYCQMSGLDMGSSHTAPAGGLSTMPAQGYCFGASVPPLSMHNEHATGVPQDQKPVFGLYPPLASLNDIWSRGNGFGEPSGMQRSSDGGPTTPTYPVTFNR